MVDVVPRVVGFAGADFAYRPAALLHARPPLLDEQELSARVPMPSRPGTWVETPARDTQALGIE
jgi:hypothetical protein